MMYGERFRQLRELQGLTQTELAEQLGVTQPFVAQVEGGWSTPPDAFIQAISFQCGFPRSFFEMAPSDEFPLGSLLFRAHKNMTEREQKAVHRHAQMAYELVQHLVKRGRVKEIPVSVPRLNGDPEEAARVTRSQFGLSPDTPVPNVINAIEKAGVLVIALPREFQRGDAFSMWAFSHDTDRRPLIVLSGGRPADRLRFSAAHELAHLVMHQPVTSDPQIEKDANRFASAFLLPADAMRRELSGMPNLEQFVNLKLKWGVAIQALIVRAYQLGLISPRRYRTLFTTLSARGWRKHEPASLQVPLERPRAVRQIVEMVYGSPINYSKLATDLKYPESWLRSLIGAHAGKRATVLPTKPVLKLDPNTVLKFKKPT